MKKTGTIILKILIYFIGWALLASIIPVPFEESPIIWRFFAELIPCLSIVVVNILFWIIEKKKINVITFANPIKNFVVGIIGGSLWLGSSTVIMSLLGVLKIGEYTFVSAVWLWILSVMINTIMQEMLVRGYMYQVLKSNYNWMVAMIVTTIWFVLMHGGVFEAGIIAVLNVFTMSILMSVVLEYTHSLVAPILMHFIWNGVGAIVLGGVSLAEDYPHLFAAEFSGNTLLSGGVYKMEGSIVTLILNLILIFVFAGLLAKGHKISK